MRPALTSIAFTLLVCAGAASLLAGSGSALAQGGPPLVTDDPDTPGNGKWEINLAGLGARTHDGRWIVSLPDADINYGWGKRIQLKVDVPWTFVREPGESLKSGLGFVNVGVKWRFVDEEEHGFAMSTYPQYLSSGSSSSKNRGITSAEKDFFLPVEISGNAGEWDLDAEVGSNFVQHGDSEWVVGGIVGHACGEGRECLFEIHETHASTGSRTLANLGLHWKLSESMVFLASAGRELTPHGEDQQGFVFYVGLQLLR
jgi:hypothetical protein